MRQHHPTADPLDWSVALERLLACLSIHDWVLQELAFWPVGFQTMFRYIRDVWERKNGPGGIHIRIPLTEDEMEDEHQRRYMALMDTVQDRHTDAAQQLPV